MPTNNAINLTSQGVPYYNGSGTFSAPTLTQYGVIVGSTSNGIASIAAGTNGQLLIGSTTANPTFATVTSSDGSISFTTGAGSLSLQGTQATTTQIGSTLYATSAEAIASSITNKALTPGGMGSKLGTQTNRAIPYGTGSTTALGWTSALTDGQVVIGSSGGNPAAATLTAGAGISITNASNSITISALGGGFTWNNITSATQPATGNNGYISNNAVSVTYTLPTSPSLGDTIKFLGGISAGPNSWKVGFAIGDMTSIIYFGDVTVSANAGYLEASKQFDSIELICIDATVGAVRWSVSSSIGNITYV